MVWTYDKMEGGIGGGTDGSRKRGRPAEACIDNIKEWTGLSFNQLIRTAEDKEVRKTYDSPPVYRRYGFRGCKIQTSCS